MKKIVSLVFVITLIVAVSSFAADDIYWQSFNFTNTTPDIVTTIFGPPAIIKTEERYSDWIKNQASGCGQVHTYAMSYSISAGDLNILKGPLGKASEVDVIIDKGIVSEVVWTYDKNQFEPAFREWTNHKGFSRVTGGVVMIGTWKPKKERLMIAECYTGGKDAKCMGSITVRYSEDIGEK